MQVLEDMIAFSFSNLACICFIDTVASIQFSVYGKILVGRVGVLHMLVPLEPLTQTLHSAQ